MAFSRTTIFLLFSIIGYVNAQLLDKKKVRVTIDEGTNMAVALSPDGKEMAIDLQGTLYVLQGKGGSATPITDALGDNRQPSWSPDGKNIVFQSYRDGNYHIWTIKKDGSNLKQHTFGIYDDREPHWSPDGRKILFASDRSGNYDIWTLSLEDNSLTQITSDPSEDYNPAWSGNGKSIVFVSSRKEKGLYIKDDRSERLLTSSSGTLAAPAFSPDGSKVYYNDFNLGKSMLLAFDITSKKIDTVTSPTEDLFPFRISFSSDGGKIYTADGKIKLRNAANHTPAIIPFKATLLLSRDNYVKRKRNFDDTNRQKTLGIMGPVVSPDGNAIAFTATGDIWMLKDDSVPEQITKDRFIDIDPAWSPDGKKLAYVSDKEGRMNLWIRDIDSGQDFKITDVKEDVMFPSWSPDGKQIAFLLNDQKNVWGNGILSLVHIDSLPVKMEVANKNPLPEIIKLHKALFVAGKPSWSPNGKLIALSVLQPYSARFREGISKILYVSLEGKADQYISPLTDRTLGSRGKNGPVWSPDGTKVAYIQNGCLWVLPVDPNGNITGPPEKLTHELTDVPSWTGDSKKIIYLATDQLKSISLIDKKIKEVPLNLDWKIQILQQDLVIHAGRLFDGKSDKYKSDVDILIKNNRIISIEPHRKNRKGKVIDASDKTVVPGLFDMHTHQYAGTGEILGRIWLAYGVTSVRETGADPYDAIERKEAWENGIRPGPREFMTGNLTDGERIYYGPTTSIGSAEQLDWELNRAVRLRYDLIKTYVRISDSIQKVITGFAHQHGLPVTSHEIYPAVSYGVDGVEHLKATSRRGYGPMQTVTNNSYNDVLQLLSKSGMNITPTITLTGGFFIALQKDSTILENLQFKALYSSEYKEQLYMAGKQLQQQRPEAKYNFDITLRTVKKLSDTGVHFTAGTDSPFVPYGLSLHTELQHYAAAGISNADVIRSATLWSAEATGVADDLGSVEAGKLADLLVLKGDPLKNIRDLLKVETVFKNGVEYKIQELLGPKK